MKHYFKNKEKIFLWSILAILLAITLFPITQFGFLVGDDLEYFLHSGFPHLWHKHAQIYFEQTGRFYFYLVKWVYYLPYLVDNQLYYLLFKIVPIILVLVLFFTLIKRVTKNNNFAITSILLFVALYSFSGSYSAFLSYPFYFTFSFSLILFSLHFLLNYFDSKKYIFLLLSSVIFATATLFYESYLVYYILIFILIISQYKFCELKYRFSLLKILKELSPFIIFGILYLAIYFYCYSIIETHYRGNQLTTNFSVLNSISTLFKMAINAVLPISSLDLFGNTPAFTNENSYHAFSFVNMSLTSYIKSTLLIIIFYFLSIKTNFGSISSRKLLHFIWISLLFIFLPNLPLAISEKYQNATLVSYVTSDFVFIAALIFFLSIYFLIISFIKPKAIRNCIFILFGIFLFFISLIIQTSNEYFAHDASISHKRFETISTFLLNDEKIEDEDNIYIEPLHFTGSNSIADITFQGMPFKIYFKRVTGKEIYQYTSYSHFYNEFNESEDTVKLFFFSQAYHSGDSYIAMISCKGTELTEDWTQLKTSRIIVGYIASNKCFALTILSQNSFEVTIENQPLKNIENYHYANLFFRDLPKMCQFEISGEQLYPYTLSISNIIYQNLAPLKIGNLPLIYKTSILERKIEQIHSESEWLSLEKIKANERGISLDSMIKIDAKWVLEKWTWHSGQTE